MGIDMERFTGKSHQPFLCAVCLDVAEDPVITQCDHMFCKSCFMPGKCPTCRQRVERIHSMDRILKAVYESLQVKCLAKNCHEDVTVSNYQVHDTTCSKIFIECKQCGAMSKILEGRLKNHDCVQHLKEQLAALHSILDERADEDRKRVKCGIVFKRGETYYKCGTCALNLTMCLCEKCFLNGNHTRHDFVKQTSLGGGDFCDCGDENYIKRGHAYCSTHKHGDNSYFKDRNGDSDSNHRDFFTHKMLI